MADGNGINAILDELDDCADKEDDVSIDDVIETLGHRGSGVFFVLPGLLGMSPLGAIPSVPTILAVVTMVISLQVVFGRKRVWMPSFLGKRSVSDDRIRKATQKLRKPARWLDDHFGQRLSALTGDMAIRAAAACVTLLALTVPPIELVPFAAALPFAAIAGFGLAITLRDGIAMLGTFIIASLVFYAVYMLMPF